VQYGKDIIRSFVNCTSKHSLCISVILSRHIVWLPSLLSSIHWLLSLPLSHTHVSYLNTLPSSQQGNNAKREIAIIEEDEEEEEEAPEEKQYEMRDKG
jgi:hypothetical protein